MARAKAKTLDSKGLDNTKLVAFVKKQHKLKIPQENVAAALATDGYSTTTGVPITPKHVRAFERLLGLPSRRSL